MTSNLLLGDSSHKLPPREYTGHPYCEVAQVFSAVGDAKVMREAKKAVHAFRRAYRAAWNLFKELGEACFPVDSTNDPGRVSVVAAVYGARVPSRNGAISVR